MLIMALAFTDPITAVFVMPLTVDAAIHSKRRFSDAVCKAHAFAMAFLAQVSIFIMAMTAFNWYLCVKKRSLYRKIFTRRGTLFLISGTWAVALITNGIPNILSLDDFFFCPGYLLCWRRMMKPATLYSLELLELPRLTQILKLYIIRSSKPSKKIITSQNSKLDPFLPFQCAVILEAFS